jgi:hypothetical protein
LSALVKVSRRTGKSAQRRDLSFAQSGDDPTIPHGESRCRSASVKSENGVAAQREAILDFGFAQSGVPSGAREMQVRSQHRVEP